MQINSQVFFFIIVFTIGSIIASFLNVVAKSVPIRENWWSRRSCCPYCKQILTPKELIPIFSFVVQLGRCKFCLAKISPLYLLAEIVGGCLFLLPLFIHDATHLEMIHAWIFFALLLTVSLTDLYYQLIPNKILIFFAVILLLTGGSVIVGLIGFSFFYATAILGKYLFKKETIGGGDIKLYFVVGLVLTLQELFLAILISSGAALVFVLLVDKKKTIPFAPFISLGALIAFLFG